MTDRATTDPLGFALWRLALVCLSNNPSLTMETLVAFAMRAWADHEAMQDSEAFERKLRQILGRWWPELQRRAAVLRATDAVSSVVVLPPEAS